MARALEDLLTRIEGLTTGSVEERAAETGLHRHRHEDEEEDDVLSRDDAPSPVRLAKQPQTVVGGTMRDYQIEALNWMIGLHDTGMCGILADEMGLGKTLETISLLAYLAEARNVHGPHLVIVPLTTLGNWMREFGKWCPSLTPLHFHAPKDDRPALREALAAREWDVCVTTYEMVSKEKAALCRIEWEYIVIDEAHRIKNEQSQLSRVARLFSSRHRLLVTGTPLQNNLQELWALLNFLVPELFDSSDDFGRWFQTSDDPAATVRQLHRLLRPFLLRRLKSDVEKALLPKIEVNLYVGMSAMQKTWYKNLLLKDVDALQGGQGRKQLLNLLMQLRKAGNHPYLFHGAEPGPPFDEGEHLVTNSGKLAVLDKMLHRLQKQGSRVLLFSQMTRMLDILEDYCHYRGFKCCRIDGNTKQGDREDRMDDFNRPGSDKFIFLLSTRAGGLGINLATADVVVLYDSDWNPQMDLQAQDRAHRIGQKKQVFVYRMVSQGTVDEKIVERATRKLFLDAMVIQSGSRSRLETNEVMGMVRFGADEIFRTSEASVTEEDIDAIMERGRERTDQMTAAIKAETEHGLNLDDLELHGQYEASGIYQFEGQDFKGKAKPKHEFVTIPKRERVASYSLTGSRRGSEKPRVKPKVPPFRKTPAYDYQLYDKPERMHVLKERAFYSQLQAEGVLDEVENWTTHVTFVSRVRGSKSPAAFFTTPLTAKEEKELETLQASGFPFWRKADLVQFVKQCEMYGRDALDTIVHRVPGRTEEEVRAYAAKFWTSYKQMPGWEKLLRQIERGEAQLEAVAAKREIVEAKMKSIGKRSPYTALNFKYPKGGHTPYSVSEDQFLFQAMAEHGYGDWKAVLHAAHVDRQFRFDWFLRTRTVTDIQHRCEYLIELVAKESKASRQRASTKKRALKTQKPKLKKQRK